MFSAISTCSFRLLAPAVTLACRRPAATPFALLFLAALGLVATLGRIEQHPSVAPAFALTEEGVSATLVATGESGLPALNEAAQSLRMRLLAIPGIASVRIEGLQTGGIALEVSPKRLQRLGISPSDIEAALPAHEDRPGVFTVADDAAASGMQAIADLPLHAGARVLRLGDVAAVIRIALPRPLSQMQVSGRPAARLVVIPLRETSASDLAMQIASAVTSTNMPRGVTLKAGE